MSTKKPETVKTLRSVMAAYQSAHSLSNEAIVQHLGLEGMNVADAIKEGLIHPSYQLTLRLADLLDIQRFDLLQMMAKDGAQDVVDNIEAVFHSYSVTSDEHRLIEAYKTVRSGATETQRVKLPGAMAFIVPEGE